MNPVAPEMNTKAIDPWYESPARTEANPAPEC